MRKASVKVTFEHYFWWMDWYVEFLSKIYSAKRVIGIRDEKTEIFEAFVFKIHTTWEVFVEALLIDSLNRDTSQYAKYMNRPLPKHLSRNICEIMLLGLGYLDWKGATQLRAKTKNILVPEHNPFQKIPKTSIKKIDQFYTIRNYLAHYSIVAGRSLSKMYKNNFKMKNFSQPGEFLYATDQKTKDTRLGNYIKAFVDAADEMAKFLNVHVDSRDVLLRKRET